MSASEMASRHRGIMASSVGAPGLRGGIEPPLAASRSRVSSLRSTLIAQPSSSLRGFSLIEVLLAIFILGIGVISIAALFPAGIAQQRRSADAVIGPIVANNAVDLIRTKLKPENFGTFEQCNFLGNQVFSPLATIPGDWPWLRPGFIFDDDDTTDDVDERGMLDIFSYQHTVVQSGAVPPIPFDANLERASEYFDGYADQAGNFVLWGIPYNTTRHSMSPAVGSSQTVPYFTITQEERYYPMQSQRHGGASVQREAPQYVWDCMFRRFGGRIYVAVFVYRVAISGGGGAARYVVPQNSGASSTVPPLPVSLDLVTDPATGDSPPSYSDNLDGWDAWGLDQILANEDDAIVRGTVGGQTLNLQDPRQAWQQSGQWLLDQNLNIHRVLSASRPSDDQAQPIDVELVRPPPPVLGYGNLTIAPPNTPPTGTPMYYHNALPGGGEVFANVVSNIWYIPLTADLDLDGNGDADTPATLTPVFATVQEL